jgi:hypothetical protein
LHENFIKKSKIDVNEFAAVIFSYYKIPSKKLLKNYKNFTKFQEKFFNIFPMKA